MEKVRSYFKGRIPELLPSDVLLEFVYTFPKYRGLNIMHYITAKLFEEAIASGAKRAIAYVHRCNEKSLKASAKIGWKPFIVKQFSWRFFYRSTVFYDAKRLNTDFYGDIPTFEHWGGD